MTKFGSIKVGGPSQTGFPKFKIFNRLNQKAKIFKTGDYERWRMAKFLDTTLWDPLPNGPLKIWNISAPKLEKWHFRDKFDVNER